MITTTEALRAMIRKLAAETPDPAIITGRILDGLTADEARVVVAATLHDYVRRAISAGTPAAAVQTYATASGVRTASRKVAAVRDWVARELAAPVCTDEASRAWKFLADCTVDDLTAAAAIRHRKAAQNAAEAERFEALAKAVEHADVATVGELPADALEAALRR
jgi:hypothetical protein